MPTGTTISRKRLEEAARSHATSKEAAKSLGIHRHSFSRLCRKKGVRTPLRRKQLRHALSKWRDKIEKAL